MFESIVSCGLESICLQCLEIVLEFVGWSLYLLYLLYPVSPVSPVSPGVCLLESVSLIERFPKLVGVNVSAGAGVGAGVHFSPALLTRPEIQV